VTSSLREGIVLRSCLPHLAVRGMNERSKTRWQSNRTWDLTPRILRTSQRTQSEHLLFSAMEPIQRSLYHQADQGLSSVARHSNSEPRSDPSEHASSSHDFDKKPIEHETAISESGSSDSYAAFVMGEVRDHLRDIHLEISALRSRLESDGPTNRVPKRVSHMSSGSVDLKNWVTEASESELSPNDGIRQATLKDDHPESPEDVAPHVPELESVTMSWASAVPVPDSRDWSKITPVDDSMVSFDRTYSIRNAFTDPRKKTISDASSSLSKIVKKERLASLYSLRAHQTLKGSEIWQRAVLSGTSIRECVMKQRLPTRRLEKFMSIHFVQTVVALCVFINSVFAGIASDIYVKHSFDEYHAQSVDGLREYTAPDWVDTGDIIFSCVFLMELLLRLLGQECRFFFGDEWKWNVFDCIVEMLALIGLLQLSGSSSQASILQNLRLLKIARAFRAIRMVRHMPWMYELRFMSLAIMNSAVPLFWACLILCLFLFIFAIVLVQGVAAYILNNVVLSEEIRQLEEYFATVGRTMLTLVMSMTGGMDWREPFDLLAAVHWIYGVLFVLFIACSVLAVLNIITSIFVTDAIEVAHMDMDLSMRGELANSRKAVKELRDIFTQMDVGGHGMVSSAMLEKALKHERIRARFALLDLDITDAVSFFQVLDVDTTGFLDMSEFVMGCLRLKSRTNLLELEVSVMDIKEMVRLTMLEQRSLGRQLALIQDSSFIKQSTFRMTPLH